MAERLQSQRLRAGGSTPPARARQVLVIANPGASRGDLKAVRDALHQHAPDDVEWRIVDAQCNGDPVAAIEAEVREARRSGYDRVAAAGGDGTVSLVANAMIRAGARRAMDLAILPLGTANVLAQELSIPQPLPRALEIALGSRHVVRLDAVRYGDQRFFTQVGVGLDAYVIENTDPESRARFGTLAYASTLAARVVDHPARNFEIEVDGRTVKNQATEVVLANAATLAIRPFTWGPGIDAGDGVLNLCIFNTQSLADFVTLGIGALTGDHPESGDGRVRHLKVRRGVVIRSPRGMQVQGDGEIIGRTPIELRVARSALGFVVPEDSDTARTPEHETPRGHETG